MRALVMLSLLAMSCTQSAPELQPFERAAGAAAMQSWRKSGLPTPDQGRCDVAAFAVRVDSDDRFVEDCRTAPSAAYGCTTWGSTNEWFRFREYPVVTIAPWWHSEPSIIIHELLHAMEQCSGLHGDGDPGHRDPRVWSAPGGPTSVQSRAMATLAQ